MEDNKEYPRKEIAVELDDFLSRHDTYDLDDVITRLEHLKIDNRNKGYLNYKLEHVVESGYYDGSDYASIKVYGYRLENDNEYQKRVDNEKANVLLQQQQEINEFERLKAKLGK